ncbi:hypothetical protein [Vogesella oryzae]|uniref:hypothetical protein n=1 Tax=Vogesella oryzae TaxID=1735285 RepID=UPI0015818339|nr:hypothetical protein [Vogesella oryzae]
MTQHHHHHEHEHEHAHSHPHPHGAGDDSHLPRWRLLAMSAGQRLLLASGLLLLLWAMVLWALGGES